MKLLFLGDSFTWGGNIDTEYGLKNKLIPNDTSYIDHSKSVYKLYSDKVLFQKLSEGRESLIWPTLLSNELGCSFKNYSTPAAGVQYLHYQLMIAENENSTLRRCYIICLPITSAARMVISSKNSIIKNSIYETLSNYCFPKDESSFKDLEFFKKYFDESYFVFNYVQSLSGIISYLKNKNISFVILPSWQKTIEEHLKLNDSKINHLVDSFVLNELESYDREYQFDIFKIDKLLCGHPSIYGQEQIKEIYLKHPFFQKKF